MSVSSFITIAGMALATYATRFSGLWAMGRTANASRFDRWLRHVPGAVLISIVAPAVTLHGWPVAAAALIAAAVAVKTKNIPVTLIAGMGAVVLFRSIG